MRIGYVLNIFPALSETFVLNEIASLLDMGHQVTVFSIVTSRDTIDHAELKKHGMSGRTHYFLGKHKVVNFLKIGIYSLGFSGWNSGQEKIASMISIPASKYFAKIAKRTGIELLHAHFNGVASHTAMLMANRLDIPFTFTTHAIDIFMKPSVPALKKRMEEAEAVMTISHYNKNYLHNLTGIDRQKIHVIRACPKLNNPHSGTRRKSEALILTVARLIEKKGIEYAIRAMREVVKQCPKAKYDIIGSGPLREELETLTHSLALDNKVTFYGNKEDTFLEEELQEASVFVLPCIQAENGDMDGIPVSLMEAMYSEVPVVSTRISGIPELVESGQEGILVEPKNSTSLSNAIEDLLENRELRRTMGEKGRSKIEREFDPYKQASKLVEIWENSIKRHSKTDIAT